MIDLISKKALIKVIENIEAKYGNDNSSLIEQGEVLDLIEEAPTVDAEIVRHAHWISAYPDIEPNPLLMYGICSNCSFEQGLNEKLNYCPNCGSKMDEVIE